MPTQNLKVNLLPSSILQIILNRPDKLNALNQDLLIELDRVLHEANTNPQVKALMITGEGSKAFCAGADIHQLLDLTAEQGFEFSQAGQRIFRFLEQLPKPSLAVINGMAFGGGCELAMSATLRIASSHAVFGQPEIKLGVIPGFGGTQRLSRLIGKGRAMDLCLTGRTFSATEALAWGFVSDVVPSELLQKKAEEILTHLLSLPPLAMASIMETIHEGYNLPLDDALHLEAAHFGLCCGTQDKREGVQAFLEKRAAKFKGL